VYYNKSDEKALQEHYRVLAERKEILAQLETRGLCAFVPDGAVLPRASGLSELPLEGAVPFAAPEQMAVTLNVCGREIRGMAVPKGITVITGGAFHGKTTLLQALTRAVYPHVPGDGREGIVVDETALRVGVEDGRSVRGTDLSMFVRDLPGGVSTKNFTTLSASGSTSEAANLLEAIEAGATTFLIDEDSSAVNFLIRDVRVRKLLGDEREPLIPLTDRIKEISAQGYSFILVAGACGDYLDLADNIVVMANYKAECAKNVIAQAHDQADSQCVSKLPRSESLHVIARSDEVATKQSTVAASSARPFVDYMQPLQKSVRPISAVERQVKVKLSGDTLLQIGLLVSDTSRLNTLVDKQQRFGAGFLLLNLLQNAASNAESSDASAAGDSVAAAIQELHEKIQNVGFRNLPQGMSREMSLPRVVDIACVAFRLRDGSR
jgi:predicted ABC-class ATPase